MLGAVPAHRRRLPFQGECVFDLRERRVLVVEDDPAVRLVHVSVLEDAGCIVTEAVDGVDALGELTRSAFDLMITDIRMPRLDGWTLAERARELDPELPVLYVGSWSEDELRPVPAGLILPKPFRPHQFLVAAMTLLDAVGQQAVET
jgi:CheY-like chemotaxis protein